MLGVVRANRFYTKSVSGVCFFYRKQFVLAILFDFNRCILDIDECIDNTACGDYGQCVNGDNAFTCTCPAGKVSGGTDCDTGKNK